jgi:hypothetical protein
VACGTLGLALLAVPAIIDARADAVDRLARTFALPQSRSVRVDATIGDVTIIGSNRDDLSVEIVRHAPRGTELARISAQVDDTSDPVRIASLQIDDGRDPNFKSEIVVKAPASARFEAVRLFEGRVRVSGLHNGCDVDVRRGGIEASGVDGRVRLESGIGSIDVNDPAMTPGGMLRLRVFNGPIRVTFDRAPANGRILALTFNGTIASDLPLAMKDRFGPRFGEATLGTGDPVLSADVVTGDIAIRVRNR